MTISENICARDNLQKGKRKTTIESIKNSLENTFPSWPLHVQVNNKDTRTYFIVNTEHILHIFLLFLLLILSR